MPYELFRTSYSHNSDIILYSIKEIFLWLINPQENLFFHIILCKSDIRNPLSLFAHERSHFLITQLHESILPELQSCLPGYQPMSHATWTEPVPSHPYRLQSRFHDHDRQSFQSEK